MQVNSNNQTNKPFVKIKDAYLVDLLGSRRLTGIPIDYPEDHMVYTGCVIEGIPVLTSKVINVDEEFSLVETERTVYEVQNWLPDV